MFVQFGAYPVEHLVAFAFTWNVGACDGGGASDALCVSCATWGAFHQGDSLFPFTWLSFIV